MVDDPTQPTPSEGESTIELFQNKSIRRVFHNNEWWYAIIDVIARLTESVDPNGYLKDMRRRDKGFSEAWGQIATPLVIETPRGPQKANVGLNPSPDIPKLYWVCLVSNCLKQACGSIVANFETHSKLQEAIKVIEDNLSSAES